MTDRTKKIIFAVIFILVSVGMGYVIYLILFQKTLPFQAPPAAQNVNTGSFPQSASGSPATAANQPTGGLPTTPGAPIPTGPTAAPVVPVQQNTLLVNANAADVTGAPNGQGSRFYNPTDGRFYTIGPDGKLVALSDKQFMNVQNVAWGNQTNQVIMDFPDGSHTYYNFQTDEQVNLPSHWQDFDFSPDDSQIAAESIGLDPSNRFLFVSKPDGTQAAAISELDQNADLVHPDWSPNNQFVAYADTGQPQDVGSEIIMVGANNQNFPALDVPGQDFLPNYSPDGKNILYSVWSSASNNKPSLWIASGQVSTLGADRREVNLDTWADKCTWATTTDIYCGVPRGLPDNAGLQRSDFISLPDDLYHVNLTTGAVSKVNLTDLPAPINHPSMSADQTKLMYTDSSGDLFSFKIK